MRLFGVFAFTMWTKLTNRIPRVVESGDVRVFLGEISLRRHWSYHMPQTTNHSHDALTAYYAANWIFKCGYVHGFFDLSQMGWYFGWYFDWYFARYSALAFLCFVFCVVFPSFALACWEFVVTLGFYPLNFRRLNARLQLIPFTTQRTSALISGIIFQTLCINLTNLVSTFINRAWKKGLLAL